MSETITVDSPGGATSAALSIESCWRGNTVYPAAAVLRIWYRGYPVIEAMPLELEDLCVLYGLQITGVEESAVPMRLGVAQQRKILLMERGGLKRIVEVVLRVSDVSVFFDVNPVGAARKNQTNPPVFCMSASLLTAPEASPAVGYVGPGALAALWSKEGAVHLVICNRPGQLAEMRFALCGAPSLSRIERGADGCLLLYTLLPFLENVPGAVGYGDALRPAYRMAFDLLLEHFSAEDDDFRVFRGDPGVFAVVARRVKSRWIVCGLTQAARTLTLRFEDLWSCLPPELRFLIWRVTIRRDPVLDESGEIVEEIFDGLAPDVRIALDLKENGGFVAEFEPELQPCFDPGRGSDSSAREAGPAWGA